jgi:uncharacterized membrane protein YjjP (DUF1212 family)
MAVVIPIVSEFNGSGVKKAIAQFKQLETTGEKAQFALKKAAVPAAAALGGLAVALGDATRAAMEDQQEQAALALTLQNVTGAGAAQTAQVEEQITAMSRASGIADTQYRKSLEALVRGTKDVDIAMKDMNLVMDISTALQMDSATVADALAKAYQGNFKALRSLTPEMATMIKEGATLDEVMNVLGGTFGGATAKNAETAAGKMAILSNTFGETKESIGAAFLPVFEKMLPVLQKFGDWAQENPTFILVLVGAFALLAAAIIAVNIAMALNPAVLITLAIMAVIAAVVIAYKKFETFRDVVDGVFKFIKSAIKVSIEFITNYVQTILGVYKSIFNMIAKLWNNTIGKLSFSVPDWVPFIGGKGFDVPDIPMLAEGGIVNSPTLALIGESGPEAVVPLDKMGGMGGGITINISGGLGTSTDIANAVYENLRFYNQNVGPLRIRTA